jgi:putative ABC transport system permease protein
MLILKLAIKNIFSAGLRTWLNVIVLSMAFLAIITTQGLLEGMNRQTEQAMIAAQDGGGQFWHERYDPYDLLSMQDAHGKIDPQLAELVKKGNATPVLIIPGTLYPGGRVLPVLVKGIDPDQKLLSIPTEFLKITDTEIPVLIGNRMARASGLKQDDYVTLQWRDAHGTFDARDVKIVQIMTTTVQSIDVGQLWMPLQVLQKITDLPDAATLVIIAKNKGVPDVNPPWYFKDLDYLLKDIHELVQSKAVGSSIIYILLIFLAMLAIFDTQVLSIFRRRKEIGTLMALGMTRLKVIQLFTLEGGMHGVLAAIMGAIYGIPLLSYLYQKGWSLPASTDSYGFAIGEKLYPSFSLVLVLGTTLLVLLITTLVSFLPTRRIARLKPTDALRGRMT